MIFYALNHRGIFKVGPES